MNDDDWAIGAPILPGDFPTLFKPATHLASPQANPDDARGSVGDRTQWADEVEAYVERLRVELMNITNDFHSKEQS